MKAVKLRVARLDEEGGAVKLALRRTVQSHAAPEVGRIARARAMEAK